MSPPALNSFASADISSLNADPGPSPDINATPACERSPIARQRKPQIKHLLPLLIGSGATLRRVPKILKRAYNTIASRQPMLALRARSMRPTQK